MSNIAYVFPGQGSINLKYIKEIYNTEEIVQNYFKQAFDLTQINLVTSIMNETIENNIQEQLITVIFEYSLYQILKEKINISPDYTAGHSLGEYVALTVAGRISFDELILLVAKRATLMNTIFEKIDTGMAAIERNSMACDILKEFENIDISNFNSSRQIVISGSNNDLQMCLDKLKRSNLWVKKLNVAGAFHSRYMREIQGEFESVLNGINENQSVIPVISNVDAQPINSVKSELRDHLVCPVKWDEIMKYFVEHNVDIMIEIGCGKTLSTFARYDMVQAVVLAYSEPEFKADFQNNINYMGLNIIKKIIAVAICTPNYSNATIEKYEEIFVGNYDKCYEYFEKYEDKPEQINKDMIMDAMLRLKEMLLFKNVSKNEMVNRILQISDETFIERFLGHNIWDMIKEEWLNAAIR